MGAMDGLLSAPVGNPAALLIVAVAAVAVVTDLRQRRIYNALTFPAMALGLAVNAAVDGQSGLARALAGLGLGIALFFVPFAFGGMGAGDLKLLAALGALGGPGFVVWCALYAGIVGGVFAVATLAARRRLTEVVGGMALDVVTGQVPQPCSGVKLPFAIPIALGAVAALSFA
jgi:prepilin peptidase CpaA